MNLIPPDPIPPDPIRDSAAAHESYHVTVRLASHGAAGVGVLLGIAVRMRRCGIGSRCGSGEGMGAAERNGSEAPDCVEDGAEIRDRMRPAADPVASPVASSAADPAADPAAMCGGSRCDDGRRIRRREARR